MQDAALVTIILGLPEVTQSAHFGTTDFRVRNKIFATRPDAATLVLKLTVEEQVMLIESDGYTFAPLPNKWGSKGWTKAAIAALDAPTARSALLMAWRNVAPKTLRAP